MKYMKNKASGIKQKMNNIHIIICAINLTKGTNISKTLALWMGICLMNSLSYVWTTWRIQVFFDCLDMGRDDIICNAILLGVGLIAGMVFSGLSVWGDEIVEKKLIKSFRIKYHDKIASLDSEKMEDPVFLNNLNRCKNGIEHTAYIVQTIFFMLTWHVPYFIFMIVYLCSTSYAFLFILLFMGLGTMLTQFLKSKYYFSLEEQTNDADRRMKYYERCIFDTAFCKETRMLNLQKTLKKKFNQSINDYNMAYKTCSNKINKIDTVCKMIMALVYSIIIVVLMINVKEAVISIGMFTAVLASIGRIEIMVRSMLISNLGYISENIGGAYSYIKLMKDCCQIRKEVELKEGDRIILKNVSFSYPGTEKEVLRGINLSIEENEKIVIVGENGSGKSTLAKILSGLYQPTMGTVTIGNQEMDGPYHIVNSTAVFQDFSRYKLNVYDNICISSSHGNEKKNESSVFPFWEERINKLLSLVNLDSMKNYNSNLSPEFGGKDISGGMWQRIAIARGVYRESNFIILDEPTAAIDPSEEDKIFNIYDELSSGKRTVIVSHRLGIARLANKIIVMKNGEIVGIGTHSNLLTANEEYREMWFSQAKYYI